MTNWVLSLILWSLASQNSVAWISVSAPFKGRSFNFALKNYEGSDNENTEITREKLRMEAVRALQDSFYASTDRDVLQPTSYNPRDGTINHLSLFRTDWMEVLGRSNVFSIHQAEYTNMFEKVLHHEPPWYIGGLLKASDEVTKSTEEHLSTWNDCDTVDLTAADEECSLEAVSGTLGTLLKIVDYRRMADGKLLLFVQAVERFVVSEIHQTLPYGIATVQIVPDEEEISLHGSNTKAVRESMERWQRYEYEQTVLPVPIGTNLPREEVLGAALKRVMPHAQYSRVCQVSSLSQERLEEVQENVSQNENGVATADLIQLEERGILHTPLVTDPVLECLTTDQLERQLWLALDAHFKSSQSSISQYLISLLPAGGPWPKGFVMETIAQATLKIAGDSADASPNPGRQVDYPAHLRQKRLSFTAGIVLEDGGDPEGTTKTRRDLLACPSTKSRMLYVIKRLTEQHGGNGQDFQ